MLLGDRLLARPFDLTPSQANILNIGAFAGALVGAAVPVVAGSDNESYIFGAAATGAFFGIAGLASSFASGDAAAVRSTGAERNRDGGARFSLRLDGLAQVVGGVRGNHVLGRFVF